MDYDYDPADRKKGTLFWGEEMEGIDKRVAGSGKGKNGTGKEVLFHDFNDMRRKRFALVCMNEPLAQSHHLL